MEALAAAVAENPAAKAGPKTRRKKEDVVVPEDWNAMLFEALIYKTDHGDLNVGAKDEEHEELFAWMQQQRRQFKLYQQDPGSSDLTADQVRVLDSLQFCWHTRGEAHWNRSYLLLKEFYKENGHCLVSRQSPTPKLGDWVTGQRRQAKLLSEGKPSRMTKKRKALLDKMASCGLCDRGPDGSRGTTNSSISKGSTETQCKCDLLFTRHDG